jgi:nitrogen regulatory protein P-II
METETETAARWDRRRGEPGAHAYRSSNVVARAQGNRVAGGKRAGGAGLHKEVVMVETAKVILVTVVAAFELEPRLANDLRAIGVTAYSVGKVDGRGVHGLRTAGLVDASSLRLEMLVAPALAQSILEVIASHYAGQPIIAYVHDVEAMPAKNFA